MAGAPCRPPCQLRLRPQADRAHSPLRAPHLDLHGEGQAPRVISGAEVQSLEARDGADQGHVFAIVKDCQGEPACPRLLSARQPAGWRRLEGMGVGSVLAVRSPACGARCRVTEKVAPSLRQLAWSSERLGPRAASGTSAAGPRTLTTCACGLRVRRGCPAEPGRQRTPWA